MRKKVKRAVQYLQTSYVNNLISYPRVDNNFILEKSFDLFPHPVLTKINDKFKPLSYNKYRITKENSLLFLSITRTITPSSIESVFNFIDKNLDDKLAIKPECKEYCEQLLKLKDEFFTTQKISNKKISELRSSLYLEVNNQQIHLYHVDEVYFTSKKTPLLSSLQKKSKNQHKDLKENTNKEAIKVSRADFNALSDAIDKWRSFSSENNLLDTFQDVIYEKQETEINNFLN